VETRLGNVIIIIMTIIVTYDDIFHVEDDTDDDDNDDDGVDDGVRPIDESVPAPSRGCSRFALSHTYDRPNRCIW
jgi:hypothetical protein